MKNNVVNLVRIMTDGVDAVTKRSPDPIDVRAGAYLRVYRNIRHMSQEELARRNDVTFQQIQKYEKGTNRISISRLYKLCAALDVEPADFIKSLSTECVAVPISTNEMSGDVSKILGIRGAYDLLSAFADMDAEDRQNIITLASRLAAMNRRADDQT